MTKELTAEQLHVWYLDATRELNPKSYNPNAQKSYHELTQEQQSIDQYIVYRILDWHKSECKRFALECIGKNLKEDYDTETWAINSVLDKIRERIEEKSK